MLTVTPTALGRIKEIIQEQEEEGAALRVMVAGMGCGGPQCMMTLDQDVNEEDIKVQQDGLTVLLDPQSAAVLEGSEIDFVETLERSGFVVNNPNFQGHGCACGGGGCGCGH